MRSTAVLSALLLASCGAGTTIPATLPVAQECRLLPEQGPRCPEDPIATRFCANGAALVYADGRETSMEDLKGFEISSGPKLCKDGSRPR
ncbi:hypothetical protein [Phenylobacterium sp.]|uniref:hypothetical protein n=1 Tax=Phenylobacterium sp. TaxID=1871053 RepID=UPI0028A0A3AA|nr:hypothetical protein [Phenylobacterium sp.]